MLQEYSQFKSISIRALLNAFGVILAFILYKLTTNVLQGFKTGLKDGVYELIVFFLTIVLFYFSVRRIKHQVKIQDIITGIIIFLIFRSAYDLILTYFHINVWDFLCFYLFGKVGISNSDFYNPAVFMKYYNDLNLQSQGSVNDFIAEIVNVGFWYPPPSMFIFLPLGLFNLQTGFIIWQTMIISFLIADVFLLTKTYDPTGNKNYISIFFPLLILLFPGITASIHFSQIVSIFLFFLILLIKYFQSWKAGPILVVLIVIKPLAAILVLYFLVFKQWKAITAFVVSGIIILLLTLTYFGYSSVLTYFTSPPTSRIPDFIYYEYESLYGILLKIQRNIPQYISIHNIKLLCYFLCFILIGITAYASGKIKKISPLHPLMAYIPMALMVYPATLGHYRIMVLPVVLYIFTQKLSHNNMLNLIAILFLYGIGFYSFFLLNFLLWIVIIGWPLWVRYANSKNILSFSFANEKPIALKNN